MSRGDMPAFNGRAQGDPIQSDNVVLSTNGSGQVAVTFPTAYRVAPVVTGTGGNDEDVYIIPTTVTPTGFTAQFRSRNSNHTLIASTTVRLYWVAVPQTPTILGSVVPGPAGATGAPGISTAGGLYAQSTIKGGDTLSATTTAEQTFTSRGTIPPNSLAVGDMVIIRGYGIFTSSGLGPSQTPRVRVGSTLAIDTGALALIMGVANYRYDFDCRFSVRAIGVSGSLECSGRLHFQSGAATVMTYLAGPTPGASEAANPVALNTTVSNAVTLSTQYASVVAANTNTLRQLQVLVTKHGTAD